MTGSKQFLFFWAGRLLLNLCTKTHLPITARLSVFKAQKQKNKLPASISTPTRGKVEIPRVFLPNSFSSICSDGTIAEKVIGQAVCKLQVSGISLGGSDPFRSPFTLKRRKWNTSGPGASCPCSHHHLLLLLWGAEPQVSQLAPRAGLHHAGVNDKGGAEAEEIGEGRGVMHGAGAAVQPPPHQVVFAGNLSQAKRGHIYRCAETPVQRSWCSSGCCWGSFCMKINTSKQRSLLSPIFDGSKFCRTCKLLA